MKGGLHEAIKAALRPNFITCEGPEVLDAALAVIADAAITEIVAWLRANKRGECDPWQTAADAIEREKAKTPAATPVEPSQPFGRESEIRPGFFEDDMP